MKRVVCAVHDSAVNAFMQPMFAPSIGAVLRSFSDEVQRAESPMAAHPSDYVLWYLGDFDEETGVFEQPEKRVLVRAKDIRAVDQ